MQHREKSQEMYLQHLPPCVQVFHTAEIVLGELNIRGSETASELIDLVHLFFKRYNFCSINLCELNIQISTNLKNYRLCYELISNVKVFHGKLKGRSVLVIVQLTVFLYITSYGLQVSGVRFSISEGDITLDTSQQFLTS